MKWRRNRCSSSGGATVPNKGSLSRKQGPALGSELRMAGRGYAITCCSERASQSPFGHWHAFLELGRPSNLGGHMSTGFRVPIRQPIRGNYGLHMAIKPVFRPRQGNGVRSGWAWESRTIRRVPVCEIAFPGSIAASNPQRHGTLKLAPRDWQALGWVSLLGDNGPRSWGRSTTYMMSTSCSTYFLFPHRFSLQRIANKMHLETSAALT